MSSFTATHKLEVLGHLTRGGNIKRTISNFYPDLPQAKYDSRRTLIHCWRRTRPKLEKLCGDCGGANKKKSRAKGEGTILPKEKELCLVRWINDLREEGVPVTATMLRIQALEVAESAMITLFDASWC